MRCCHSRLWPSWARAIGIVRWLTVMPALAAAHAAASPETRTQLEQVFSAITT